MASIEELVEEKMRESSQGLSLAMLQAAETIFTFYRELVSVVFLLDITFENRNKVYVAGNGGSATQAMHFSDEMVGRYKENRRPYPVIALNADSAVLTCIGNDFGYEHVFSRQIEALGVQGDVFVALSTSGNSPNIVLAAEQAKKQGVKVVALTGMKGKLLDVADYRVRIPTDNTARMQEMHLHAIHLICEAYEPGMLAIRKRNGQFGS